MKYLTALVFLLVGIPATANAFDIPAPRPKPKPEAKADDNGAPKKEETKSVEPTKKLADPQRFTIQIDEKAKVAKLLIPNSIIRKLQVEGAKSGALIPSEQVDIPSFDNRIGTVVGGALMTLAAIFGGLWFVRNRKTNSPQFAAAAIIILLSGVGTVSYVYANAGPPPESRSLTSKILKYSFATGEVQVETTNDADQIVLILPQGK